MKIGTKRISRRSAIALGVSALAAVVAIPAQAMGFDVASWLASHPELALGLSGLAFMGDTTTTAAPPPPTPPVDDVKQVLARISDQVKEVGEKALAEAQRGVAMSKSATEKVDELLIKQGELVSQVRELEQKVATGGGGNAAPQAKSWGEQLVESDAYKAFVKSGGRGSFTMSMDRKTVTAAAAGGFIRPRVETDVVALPRRRMTMRQLLVPVPVDTSSVDYPRQTTRTNNAAPVAEGALKPYSDFAWTTATVTVRTIAHLAKLTRQAMDDAPRLIGEVDSEMRFGLAIVEEAQLLYGDGTGQNLTGIMPQATPYVAPITITGATNIDTLRLAMLQASLALYPADGIVLNPSDWTAIELTKTADGGYLFANPQGTVGPRLWGLPVVDTPAMAMGEFLVGNFGVGATLYDRMAVEVLISTENADDFERNLATMRAEERLALAVKRPASFVSGTLAAPAP